VNTSEERLRAELRAESELITQGSLRQLDFLQADDRASVDPLFGQLTRNGHGRQRLAWLAPIAAAASVAAIVATAAVISHHGHGPSRGPQPGGAGRPTAGELRGIAAFSARDAWAVGSLDIGQTQLSNMTNVPLMVHWNGSQWQRVSLPKVVGADDELASIAGTSPSNLWAVGVRDYYPMVMHWDGHTWRLQSVEAEVKSGGSLSAVAVRSATDAWAVGYALGKTAGGYGPDPLILHWNGRTWDRVPAPATADHGALVSVAAISARDAWAVGTRSDYGKDSSKADNSPQILHWNGSSWAQVPDPQLRGVPPELVNVEADSTGTVWATGFIYSGQHPAAVILRWTGTAWQQVALPKGLSDHRLGAVDVISSRDIWVVGGGSVEQQTVIMHWNGVTWTRLATRGTTFPGGLNGLAASSASDIWAVGYRGEAGAGVPQILHWNGSKWTRSFGPASTSGLFENSSCGPYTTCAAPTPTHS
jgi:hypothetical protein